MAARPLANRQHHRCQRLGGDSDANFLGAFAELCNQPPATRIHGVKI